MESKEANRSGWMSVQFIARATLVVEFGGKVVVRLAIASLENLKIFMIVNRFGLLRLITGKFGLRLICSFVGVSKATCGVDRSPWPRKMSCLSPETTKKGNGIFRCAFC